jgi:hypothetical protein
VARSPKSRGDSGAESPPRKPPNYLSLVSSELAPIYHLDEETMSEIASILGRLDDHLFWDQRARQEGTAAPVLLDALAKELPRFQRLWDEALANSDVRTYLARDCQRPKNNLLPDPEVLPTYLDPDVLSIALASVAASLMDIEKPKPRSLSRWLPWRTSYRGRGTQPNVTHVRPAVVDLAAIAKRLPILSEQYFSIEGFISGCLALAKLSIDEKAVRNHLTAAGVSRE